MTIIAKIIADSVSPDGIRLTTLQLRYPKFIHGEFMTHRAFSRNASSSRAIPVQRLIQDVIDDPVYPSFWGKNQPGMQAAEECDAWVTLPVSSMSETVHPRNDAWDVARMKVIDIARAFDKAGYHKQIVNRLIEPFCYINVVVTATEWKNFFELRCHKDAQPEMRLLAEAIRDAMAASYPRQISYGGWHLPYVNDDEIPEFTEATEAVKCSVARCARVSYLTQDGKPPTREADLKLYDRLVGAVPIHASPAEHQATPDIPLSGRIGGGRTLWCNPKLHGNFIGWIQYRKHMEFFNDVG